MSGTHLRLLTEYLSGDSWRRRASFGLQQSLASEEESFRLGNAACVRALVLYHLAGCGTWALLLYCLYSSVMLYSSQDHERREIMERQHDRTWGRGGQKHAYIFALSFYGSLLLLDGGPSSRSGSAALG